MSGAKRSASEAGDLELRFARAPADRLLLACILALSLAYAGWLLALRLWPGEPEDPARQGFHGFVGGSSQPPPGPGEQSPAAAGEFGSSKLGTSHYFGGATPRPMAEGAKVVAEVEPPKPSRAPVVAPAVSGGSPAPAAAQPGANAGPGLGRLDVGARVSGWVVRRLDGLTLAARECVGDPCE